MQHANFTRKQENFVCECCGTHVTGNGYTNHCPKCLCSKHVDDKPGDRAATCHGLMIATGFEIKHGTEYITHTCQKCGHTRANKVSPQDSRDAIIALASGHMAEYLAHLTGTMPEKGLTFAPNSGINTPVRKSKGGRHDRITKRLQTVRKRRVYE